MTRYTPLWQQNSSYPASVDRGLIATLWPTTAAAGAAPTIVTNSLTVSIPAGVASVALTTAANLSELCRWDAAEIVTHGSVPPSGQSRIDLIVLQVRDAAVDAGGNNDFLFQVVAGAPTTGTPVRPATPTNAMAVAAVTIPGGSTNNLNAATLVDLRAPLYSAGPRDTLHAVVARAAALTIPATDTSVAWDTVVADAQAMWSPGQVGFVVPVAGFYTVTMVLVPAIVAGATGALKIYQAGSPVRTTNFVGGTVTAYNTLTVTATLKCTAAQLIQTAANIAGGRGDINPGAAANFASIDYLGTG